MDMTTIELEGIGELAETIDKMIAGISPDKIEPILDKASRPLATEVRARAPVGPTGNLKKSIKRKKLNRLWGQPAPYIVAIDRRKASHAWLVVHGTSGVRKVDPPRKVVIGGRHAVITHTGVMPPNRFVDDAYETKKSEVLNLVENAISKNLDEAMK